MIRTFKYKLRLRLQDRVAVEQTLTLCRNLYNTALEQKNFTISKPNLGVFQTQLTDSLRAGSFLNSVNNYLNIKQSMLKSSKMW